jgi:cysteine-rich repeat protein
VRIVVILLAGLLASLGSWPSSARADILNVDAATDICPASANPCSITQRVQTVDGAILNFGTRTVVISGVGQIDSGNGSLFLQCGRLDVTTSGTAFKLVAPLGAGTDGGFAVVETRRTCSGNSTLVCLADSTCASASAGTCTVGSGNLTLNGKVDGNADNPAALFLRAAGDVQIGSSVTANGLISDADGGTLDIVARGSVTISAKPVLTGGLFGSGGSVDVRAGGNITLSNGIDVNGGDFDGGLVDISANGNVLITDDITANAVAGGGFGGEIAVQSGGNLEIVGGGSTNRLTLSTDGHQSIDNFGGDGGPQDFTAGGDLHFGPFVKITADGAFPDGFGEFIFIDARGDVSIEADIQAKPAGNQGGGGEIDASANGSMEVTGTATFTLTGSSSGGGDLTLFALGDLQFDGDTDLSAGSGGGGGGVDLDSRRNLTVTGSVLTGGEGGGIVDFSGCDVRLTGSADIDNNVVGATNRFKAREQFTAQSGSSVSASGGTNQILYRSPAKPPVVGGAWSPAPQLLVQPTFAVCPVCGNSTIEPGETCDDGDATGGDGCSGDCQNEGCIAQTPGYPSVGLCDDGDPCTADACNNSTSSCTHVSSCDDGIACTVDSCAGTTCTHVPTDSLCTDPGACGNTFCSAVTGCVLVPVAGSCNDGQFCNGVDSCSGGTCSVHTGAPCANLGECKDGCNEAFDVCGSPFGTPCTEDGNLCTDDVCDGGGTCISLDNSDLCDDGVFCNGVDVCTNGSCSFHVGDPCILAGECADTCVESIRACRSPQFEPCSSDGNLCTDDYCNGLGGCGHVANVAPCEDGDFCTTGDTCGGGTCVPGGLSPFSSIKLQLIDAPGLDDDRFVLKAVQPIASLSVLPSEAGVLIELRDETDVPRFTAVVPPSSVVDVGDGGRVFKFRDSRGEVPSANGLRTMTVRRDPAKGIVRTKARMEGTETSGLVANPDVSLSVLFGANPSVGDCISAQHVACLTKGGRSICAE